MNQVRRARFAAASVTLNNHVGSVIKAMIGKSITSEVSSYLCPSCGQELDIDNDDGEVLIFCSNLACNSDAANHGASGPNAEIAFQRLLSAIEVEENEIANFGSSIQELRGIPIVTTLPMNLSCEFGPCPFCGSTKITVEWEACPPLDSTDTNRRWFAECTQCSCQGPFCQKETQVIRAWNLRYDSQEMRGVRSAGTQSQPKNKDLRSNLHSGKTSQANEAGTDKMGD